MNEMMSTLSPSDVALLNQDGGFGGNNSFLWIFALLILAGGGFGGLGFGNRGNLASQSDVQDGFNFAALERQNNEIIANTTAVGANVITAIKDGNYNNLSEIRSLEAGVTNGFAAMQNCCCDLQRGIDSVNYNGAINTASINANTTAQTQKILDAISTNRMADMQNQINQLQLQNAMCGVVRYPSASTYYAGNNPFGTYCGCCN